MLDSSAAKLSSSDCQRPEVLDRNKVKGNILVCGYSFNFILGTSSVKKVSETAKSLGAAGFILAVENVSPGTKFEPVPVSIPGILITQAERSKVMKTLVCLYFFIVFQNPCQENIGYKRCKCHQEVNRFIYCLISWHVLCIIFFFFFLQKRRGWRFCWEQRMRNFCDCLEGYP